jgi:hypothetical protein
MRAGAELGADFAFANVLFGYYFIASAIYNFIVQATMCKLREKPI